MESDSALHGDVPDGAEVSPLEENQAGDAIDASESNVTSNEEAAAAEESGNHLFMSNIFTCILLFVIVLKFQLEATPLF